MSSARTLEGDWSLGAVSSEAGKHTFRIARELSDDERSRIPPATARLGDFNGETLVGPLTDSVTALLGTLDEFPDAALSGPNRGQFRSRLHGQMSAALTSFTGLRASVERHAEQLALPMGGGAPAQFAVLHREHPSYRFVWMLRNLDQHRPPASGVLRFQKDEDPETGEPRSRPTIDVLAVANRCAEESTDPRHRKQWEQCAALWRDQTEPVDARAVFRSAYNACFQVVVSHLREAEPIILEDAVYIARLIAEIEPWGAARVIGLPQGDLAGAIDLQILDLSLGSLQDALTTLERTRSALGQRTLIADGVLPADFPFFGNSIHLTERPFRTVPAPQPDGQ